MHNPNLFHPALAGEQPFIDEPEATAPSPVQRLHEFGQQIITFAWPKGAPKHHKPTHGDSVSRQKPVYPNQRAGEEARKLLEQLKKKKK